MGTRVSWAPKAADGTRTHGLLHGKQWQGLVFPLFKRIRGAGDSRGLPAITGGFW